ncbi:MAG: RnfABCDGE type electron transport complex subunit D [Gammaproteobacteria bacterium]|nr:MAG: RnfABCDGE type electron transport complex subunit D [Gammaproteobacteria bacterium]
MASMFANTQNAGRRYQRLFKLRLLALLPVCIAAVLNTGYQYLAVLADAPELAVDDLRGNLASGLGAAYEDPGLYDMLAAGLAHFLPVLIVALVIGGFWERIIAARRQRPIETGFILIALLFTLMLPGAVPFFHVVYGMSFAVLLGKGIFGGDGKTFLSPALLGVAIVQVSFPGAASQHPLWQGLAGYAGSDAIALFNRGGEAALSAAGIDPWSAFVGSVPGTMGTTSVLAILLGAALLLRFRVIAWRLLLAQLVGVIVIATLFNLSANESGAAAMPAHWHLLLGSFAFGAVFIACDPFASACTNPGRWIQGFLIGALVVLIRVVNSTHPDAVVPAMLLASILAPLIDHAVIAWNIRKRAQRHV